VSKGVRCVGLTALPLSCSDFLETWAPEPSGTLRACPGITLFYLLLIEKRREFNLDTNLLFIDYEKAFDNIKRQILFNILKSRHIPDTLLKGIVDDYTQNKIMIKAVIRRFQGS
jgi:hypothetical protein